MSSCFHFSSGLRSSRLTAQRRWDVRAAWDEFAVENVRKGAVAEVVAEARHADEVNVSLRDIELRLMRLISLHKLFGEVLHPWQASWNADGAK